MDGNRRLARELRTIAAMLRIHCRDRHHTPRGLCAACAELLTYAETRVARCPYGAAKPTCANCPIHCYRAHRREQIREVMRYAGPRMPWHHPVLSLFHILDGSRPAPDLRRCRAEERTATG